MDGKIPLILIAVVVVVSGCTGGNSSDSNAADHSIACSSLGINVPYANGKRIRIVNIGSASFGNVTVTWNYANGGKITKEFQMPDAHTSEAYKSNSSGTIKGAMAIHTECPSVSGSY